MLPWAEMMRAALVMGIGPEAFWRLSLAEWRWLTGVRDRVPDRNTLERLMKTYPDRRRNDGSV